MVRGAPSESRFHRHGPQSGQNIPRNRFDGIIVLISLPGNNRDAAAGLVEQVHHLSEYPGFGPGRAAEEKDVVFAQQGSFHIRNNAVFVTDNARKSFFLLQLADQVAPHFFADTRWPVTRVFQFRGLDLQCPFHQ